MKKILVSLSMMVGTLLSLSMMAGTLSAMGENYPYLTFETSDGSKTSISTASLTINIQDGKLMAGSMELTLADLIYNGSDLALAFKTPSSGGSTLVVSQSWWVAWWRRRSWRTLIANGDGRLFCGGFKDLGECRMNVYHIGQFANSGMLAHQHTDFLDDVGTMGAISMTT